MEEEDLERIGVEKERRAMEKSIEKEENSLATLERKRR
jgi:hypothetical protein